MAVAFAHPATFYVRYLLLVLEDPSREAVNRQLELYGLAPVKESQYETIAGWMTEPPPGFRMHDKKHRPSTGWLRSMRIYGMVHRDQVVRDIFSQVLSKFRLRETVERLALGNVSTMEMSYRLRELGFRIHDSILSEFLHFFWNTEIMGVSDWADYLKRDASTGRTGAINDFYVAALHGGPELAMYHAGIKVEVDAKALLEEVRAELAFTFREVRGLPLTQKKVEMLGTLTRNIIKVDERMAASDSALQDVLKRFEKFRVIDDAQSVPSLVELAPSGTVSDKTRTEILRTREA